MSKIKDLTKFSATQLQEFLMSFDIVMSDIDGVVRQINKDPIEGAMESLAAMQKMGKQVYLVTNNSTNAMDDIFENARRASLNLSSDRIINTIKVIVWYLKKIDFRDEVFAIVSELSRNILKEAGIRLVEEPKAYETNAKASVKEVLDRPSVKAVIVDFDLHINWSKLALAISCLKRKDVLYIAGVTDEWFNVQTSPHKINILGGGPLINVISAQSGRKPILYGKPSEILRDYIVDTCNVTDPRRCLFIGDTADQDMKFASMCGFMKLFIGSGCNTLEETQKEEDTCPDYYLPTLGQLFSAYTSPQC
ncbi:chronophin-like [Linepithema humile]|uniref:chronophin-like n=1 Tax=Linepithema humile TaxID=83485 RepID=UPI0006235580|nr:PREDICTED: 4-nitrophenylphosphatase-like [Linepithema humile]